MGSGTAGHLDDSGLSAQFDSPRGVAVSPNGQLLWVSDNHRIREITIATLAITTVAGSVHGTSGNDDGVGSAATFTEPGSMAVTNDGTTLYVVQHSQSYGRIRRVIVSGLLRGTVTTVAGSTRGDSNGIGTAAQFDRPRGIAISNDQTKLYMADFGCRQIRQIVIATQAVTTFVGQHSMSFADGVGSAARFSRTEGLVITPDGSTLYVADFWNTRVRRVDISSQAVTSPFGSGVEGYLDGIGTAAQFVAPVGLAISPDGSTIFVASDSYNLPGERIRQIDISSSEVSTVAGSGISGYTDGWGPNVQLGTVISQLAVATDNSKLFIPDEANNVIRVAWLTPAPPSPPPSPPPPSPPPPPPPSDVKKVMLGTPGIDSPLLLS